MILVKKIQVLGQTEFVPRGYEEQRKWLLDRIEEGCFGLWSAGHHQAGFAAVIS